MKLSQHRIRRSAGLIRRILMVLRRRSATPDVKFTEGVGGAVRIESDNALSTLFRTQLKPVHPGLRGGVLVADQFCLQLVE